MSSERTYPRWKHHATKEPVIIQDAAEEKKLGEEWGDFPGGPVKQPKQEETETEEVEEPKSDKKFKGK